MTACAVTVVVPTHGRPASIVACLEALAAQRFDEPWEVVVVDDGSPEPVAEAIAGRAPGLDVRVVRQPNAGPAAARNRGVAEALGRFVAFTDDDCRPAPDWLARLVTAARERPGTLVGGTTVNGLPDDLFATASQSIVDLVYDHFNAAPDDAYFLASNNCLCERERFLAVGGFDGTFPRAGAEDREFCDRWRASGWPIAWTRDAKVEHRHAQTLRRFLDLHLRYGRGAYRYQTLRRRRGSGTMREDLGFHRSLVRVVPRFLASVPGLGRRAGLLGALGLWQAANALGFGLEWLDERAATSARVAEPPRTSEPAPSSPPGRRKHDGAILLLAVIVGLWGAVLLGYGIASAWGRDSDLDLLGREMEYRLFRVGAYPNAAVDRPPPLRKPLYAVYPPWAYPLFALFFEPGELLQGRILLELASLASLVVMGGWAWRVLARRGAAVAALGAVAGTAIAGNATALAMGQFSILCMGLVVQQWICLGRGATVAAGICWGLAMVKPQIALCFAATFLVLRRPAGLAVGMTLMAAASLLTCLWTDVSPFDLLAWYVGGQSMKFSNDGFAVGPGAIAKGLGLDHRVVTLGLAALAATAVLPLLPVLGRRGSRALMPVAGACAVLGMLTTYHRHYDNVMLFPTLIAVIDAASGSRRPWGAVLAAVLLVSLAVPKQVLVGIPWHEVALAAVWCVSAIYPLAVLLGEERGASRGGEMARGGETATDGAGSR